MPYTHGNMTMYVLLPNECDGIVGLQDKLNIIDFNEFNDITTERVRVVLPKFRIVYSKFLKRPLSQVNVLLLLIFMVKD